MKISANEEYGLRIILCIAGFQSENPSDLVSLNQIADAEGISPEYTASIITLLKSSKLVESVRGKNGGYKLGRPAEEITLYQIINALSDKPFASGFCDSHTGVMERCMHSENCSIRPVWTYITNLLDQFFSKITLSELMKKELDVKDLVTENMIEVVETIK
ncbi:MAG: Rrf2 family transcriptional regulator [Candidatus Caenarcaniphilales bacterium]|nr:Rrf2 family transcriptional regulator [Candidatus Caenarcaniphilales bacterium]